MGASNERLRASKGRGTYRADEQALQRQPLCKAPALADLIERPIAVALLG